MNIVHLIDGCDCTGKHCPGCTHIICILGFNKNRSTKDKLQAYCRDCDHARHKQWRENNKDKHRLRMARYLQKEDNRAKHNAISRRYTQNNWEKAYGASKRWRQNNPKRVQEYRKGYVLTPHSRQVMRSVSERWRRNNLERKAMYDVIRRTRKTQAGGSYTFEQWEALKAQYDNTCLRCGRTDVKLTPDHVIPVSKFGTSYIENIQPLCMPCNSWKQDKIIDYRPNFRRKENSS